ncbi:MAG: hypothetical protein JNM56_04800 [Planctomycetia bacterium]|nr:hypothetical protein [Planctomycetia bacterium]
MTAIRYIGEVPPPPPKPAWGRRLIFHGLLLVLALVGTYLGIEYHADWELRQALAEADQLDPGWRLEELEASRAEVSAEQNAARMVLAVKELIPDLWYAAGEDQPDSSHEMRFQINRVPPQHQYTPEMVEFLHAGLERAKPALVEARKLANFPRGRYAVDWQPDYYSTALQAINAHDIAELLAWDIKVQSQQGDFRAALHSLLAQLNAFRASGDEPSFVSILVRISGQGIVAWSLERILGKGEADAHDLEQLQRLLLDEANQDLLLLGARADRAGCHHLFQSLEAGKISDFSAADLASLESDKPSSLVKLSWHIPFVRKRQRALILRLQNCFVEIAKLPEQQQPAAMREWQDQLPQEKNLAAVLLMTGLPQVPFMGQRAQARLRTTIAALAVERYRLDRGNWPDSLEVLCPCYLSSVPVDPFDFEPLRYRRVRDGVVIYSCGRDGADNGGVIPRQGLADDTGYDLGFQLWDVDQRRQPPLPPEPVPQDEPF